MAQHPCLVLDLGPAQEGGKGAAGGGKQEAQVLYLLLQLEAGYRRKIAGYPHGGGMGAVADGESGVDEDIGQAGKGPGKNSVISLFPGVKSDIL